MEKQIIESRIDNKDKKNEKDKEDIEKLLIDIALKIAKKGDGCLFVLGKPDYQVLVEQNVKPLPFPISSNPKLVESLARIDGACIVDKSGNLVAYGALIKNAESFKNHGTRHAAAYSASANGVSILASEEDRKVRIFKNKSLVIQIDALERGIEMRTGEAAGILESVGVGAIGTLGVGLIPGIGIALLPGVLVFGGSYFAIKSILRRFGKA